MLYYDPIGGFPDSKEKTGRFVGIAENVGDALTFWILTDDTNEVIARSDVRPYDEEQDPNLRAAAAVAPSVADGESETEPDAEPNVPTVVSTKEGQPLPTFDPLKIIGMSFLRDRDVDGTIHRAEVIEQLPLDDVEDEDSIQYVVKLGGGAREDVMTYGQIVNALTKQYERDYETMENGERHWTFRTIGDHRKKGNTWEVLVNWDDGSATWEPLSVIAKDDPVTVAAYAKDNELLDTPGWKRLRRLARNDKKIKRMLKQVQLNAMRNPRMKVYKFGVEIPRDYDDAVRLDEENGNTLWQDATKLEMKQLHEYKTFRDLGKGAPTPAGYKMIKLHLIFDCKHDFRRKARMVAGGHMTDPPKDTTYSSVVSLQSLRTVMFIGELNGMKMCAGDIGNAYLEAYTTEKVCFVAGPEFGELAGHTLIIVKALYGLRSSGARFHDLFAETMSGLKWFPSKADPDVWMLDCGDHWEYVATWVDDLLYIGMEPEKFYATLRELGYKLKGVGEPTYHLGGDFKRVKEPEDVLTWGSHTFVKKMLSKYEKMMGEPIPKREVHAPLEPGDHPELDDTEFCNAEQTKQYQSMLGDMQWAVSLGRIDIFCATMTLGGFRAMPRVGHLERAKRVYTFLRNYKKTSIKFRTEMPDYSQYTYVKPDWGHVYHPCKEDIPNDMPTPRGKPILTTTFWDANLLFDYVTGRSATGIIHLLNKTPIGWFCKRQGTVETATYGSEFVAGRIAVEQIIDLRTTLRYFGARLAGPSVMFGDNKAVVDSGMIPSFRLKKRHNILAFHRVREAVACDIVRLYHIDGRYNPADILTKHRSSREWYELMKPLIFWTWRDDPEPSVRRSEGSDNISSELVTEH